MARIKNGIPTVKEVKEGESIYRYVQGVGLVLYVRYNNQLHSTKMQPLSAPAIADKKLNQLIKDEISTSIPTDDFIKSDGSVTYTGSQSFGGNNITGVNDLTVGDDVSIGDELNVDGHSKLDQVTIDTTDGAFLVSGSNSINLSTSGTNDIDINTSQTLDVGVASDYELDVTRTCDWNTATTDWDNSNTFTLTSLNDITIETDGTDGDSSGNDDSSNTILIKNANSNNADFTGIHIKTDSQGAASAHNGILIECDNVASKGGTAGVDVRSENGIRLRAENDNSSGPTGLLMRATGPIDIGVGSSLTPHSTNLRVKIHGLFETSNLWRDADAVITMDRGEATGGSATGVYTKFQALDTTHLVRAQTYKASGSSINVGVPFTIVSSADDDNGLGTVWLVTIVWHHGTSNDCMQSYICFGVSSTVLTTKLVAEELSSNAGGLLTWTSGAGIVFTNNHSSGAATGQSITTLKASALRLQSKDDF